MRPSSPQAFTLVELLVSTAVISALALILVSITGQTSSVWRNTAGKVEQFRESRDAFDTLTTRISQATLNTYWDYDSATLPTTYQRRSELRFVSGPSAVFLGNGPNGSRVTHCLFFHALLGVVDNSQGASGSNSGYQGLENLLNAWGYYLEFGNDTALRPAFLATLANPPPPKYRFRLMEFRQSSEQLLTYRYTSGLDPSGNGKAAAIGYQGAEWYKTAVNSAAPPSRTIAENIIALIITPRLSKEDEMALPAGPNSSNPDYSPLAPNYSYDSSLTMNPGQPSSIPATNPRSQLPPLLQVTMVAIDETSAVRLNLAAASADIFNVSTKFTSTLQYTADLAANSSGNSKSSLENSLIAKKVNYRVFTTNIPIRAAKWSRNEVN